MLTPDLIFGFSEAYLKTRYDSPKETPAFHHKLWEYCCLPDKYVAIAAPRGHAKSTAVTYTYALCSALFRTSNYIVIVGDTETQASQFLNNLRTELVENEGIIQSFGPFEFEKETETDLIVKCPDGHRFRIRARGAAQPLRGMLWAGKTLMRPDLVIIDDLENDELVMNEERRLKLREWFYGAVIPMLSDLGKIRMVGTILHMDSLLERLMPKERDPFTVDTPLFSYNSSPFATWRAIKFRAHDDGFEHILWVDKFPKERLLKERQGFIEQGHPDKYSQEYLNYPIDAEYAFFKKTQFLSRKSKDEPLNYYIGTDFALTRAKKGDFSVFVVFGMNSENVLVLVEVVKFQGDQFEIADEILRLQRQYNPEFFCFEKGAIWLAVQASLDKRSMETGVFLSKKEIPSFAEKEVRARPLQDRMRMGAVQFDKETDWYPDFESEMLRFPFGQRDDQVDAAAIVAMALKDMVAAKTTDEIEEEIYQRDMHEYDLDSGMSSICGY